MAESGTCCGPIRAPSAGGASEAPASTLRGEKAPSAPGRDHRFTSETLVCTKRRRAAFNKPLMKQMLDFLREKIHGF